jgi:nitrite reductase (NADH) small subunit
MNAAQQNGDERWIDVCAVEELSPNRGVCAFVAGSQVAVFYLIKDKTIYAVDNYDPFSKANVLSRGITGDIKGEVVVASPIYKQHFSLKDGQCLEDASVRINTYPVRVVAGRVQIGHRSPA